MKSGHSEPLAGIVDSGKSTAIGIADTTEHNHVEAERESIQSKSIGVHVCWRTCGSAPGKMRRRASTGSNSGRKLRPPMLAVTPTPSTGRAEAGCRCRWSWPSDTTTNLSKCRAHCLVMDTSSHNLLACGQALIIICHAQYTWDAVFALLPFTLRVHYSCTKDNTDIVQNEK